jgi:hypothetical protein
MEGKVVPSGRDSTGDKPISSRKIKKKGDVRYQDFPPL